MKSTIFNSLQEDGQRDVYCLLRKYKGVTDAPYGCENAYKTIILDACLARPGDSLPAEHKKFLIYVDRNVLQVQEYPSLQTSGCEANEITIALMPGDAARRRSVDQ